MATFPPSQGNATKTAVSDRPSGKGARKRQSSVPPDSDTAKAKQSKKEADAARTDEPSQKSGIGKGRPRAISKPELNLIAD